MQWHIAQRGTGHVLFTVRTLASTCTQTALCNVDVFTSSGALMIEEDAIAGKDLVCLSVVDGDPVAIELGRT